MKKEETELYKFFFVNETEVVEKFTSFHKVCLHDCIVILIEDGYYILATSLLLAETGLPLKVVNSMIDQIKTTP